MTAINKLNRKTHLSGCLNQYLLVGRRLTWEILFRISLKSSKLKISPKYLDTIRKSQVMISKPLKISFIKSGRHKCSKNSSVQMTRTSLASKYYLTNCTKRLRILSYKTVIWRRTTVCTYLKCMRSLCSSCTRISFSTRDRPRKNCNSKWSCSLWWTVSLQHIISLPPLIWILLRWSSPGN